MQDLQRAMKFSTLCALHTMVWPQHLLTVGNRDRLVGSPAWMCGGKRKMAARMPILGKNHVLEPLGHTINDWRHLVSAWDCKSATRTEVFLHIDHDQDVAFADCYTITHGAASFW
jgi:hypothetical protein